jgi:hypothetical protein
LPKTVSVDGQVTYQGKPLDNGSVVFSPAATVVDTPARPATAQLAPDGTYRLSSFRRDDGVMPGEYRVTVVSYISPPSPEQQRAAVWRIPARYGDPAKSGLTCTVPADAHGAITYNIELK